MLQRFLFVADHNRVLRAFRKLAGRGIRRPLWHREFRAALYTRVRAFLRARQHAKKRKTTQVLQIGGNSSPPSDDPAVSIGYGALAYLSSLAMLVGRRRVWRDFIAWGSKSAVR
jgi:hypothetical protein